jgi:hypothetical protein
MVLRDFIPHLISANNFLKIFGHHSKRVSSGVKFAELFTDVFSLLTPYNSKVIETFGVKR